MAETAPARLDGGVLRVAAPIGCLVVVLALFGALLAVQWNGLEARRTLVAGTQASITAANSIVLRMLDAETGQRGLIITGNERYLAPYLAARRDLPDLVASLSAQVRDDPQNRAQAGRIGTLVEAKLAELEQTVALVRTGDRAAVARAVGSGRGKALMDALRTESETFVAQQQRRLQERLDDVSMGEVGARNTVLIGFAIAGLALLVSLIALLGAHRRLAAEVATQRRLADGFEAAKDELARRFDSASAELADASMRLETALRGSRIVVASQDRDLRYRWVRNAANGGDPSSLIGKSDADFVPEPQLSRLVAAKLGVVETGEAATIEINVPGREGGDTWLDLHLEPMFDAEGRIDGITSVGVDVTDRRRREQHIRLLMRELAHRSKNTLAVVQAMARQTAASASSKDDFVARFEARLEALGAAHSLLVNEGWSGARIGDLVRSQLGHCLDLIGKQIFIDGPPLTLPIEMIQNIGLALHELATNAAKYGALSTPHGRVDIDWTVTPAAAGANLVVMRWIESDGPPVEKPTRRGFGRIVVERTVARAVGGTVDLDYDPAGLRWKLTFELAAEAVSGAGAATPADRIR
ncbi:CHASE3 domain-containing protein [Methylobrevis albus]|uniref:Blue-light-activated histidine kinase n=1 Tax=Methylobrevis albus TaxID=2793297 RepID=A0A931I0M9_9HYPH|nr:CHASE3 domain-containing protein [Methylobrevis albus]MBH0237259.1 CHASE3 domain-containing protein [Methylobrevis albus]